MAIHLVYPHRDGAIAAPWTIGNHLASALREAGHEVHQYDWQEVRVIHPRPGDVLIGHPHPQPGFVFEASLGGLKWSARIAMTPWGGLPLTEDLIDRNRDRLEGAVLICGPYWAQRIPERWSGFATAVDMAIDASCYPRVRHRPSQPGRRGIVYIGCSGAAKGTDLLEGAIRRCPSMRFGHVGLGYVAGAIAHGYHDFRRHDSARLVGTYDFLLCPGANDANPTVALEAACWGLLPLCTETSGWTCFPIVPGDPVGLARELGKYQMMDGLTLGRIVEHVRDVVMSEYTWERFTDSVRAAARI